MACNYSQMKMPKVMLCLAHLQVVLIFLALAESVWQDAERVEGMY